MSNPQNKITVIVPQDAADQFYEMISHWPYKFTNEIIAFLNAFTVKDSLPANIKPINPEATEPD